TTAAIQQGAKVNVGDPGLKVDANQDIFNLSFGTSGSPFGASGAKFGLNGTFDYVGLTSNTKAQVYDGAQITSNAGSTGGLSVDATDKVVIVSIAGANFSATNGGFGLTGVLNDINRTTEAIIGVDTQVSQPSG